MQVSPFLIAGDRQLKGANGTPVQPVFLATSATAMAIPSDLYDRLRAPSPALSTSEVAALARARILVNSADDERARVLTEMGVAESSRAHPHYVLLPTAFCNMGCTYCGQDHQKGGLANEANAHMREVVIEAISDPVVESITVDWFGGEPLLAFRHVIEMGTQFSARARAAGTEYRSTLITNGALLTTERLRRLVLEACVGRLIVTIDGPAHVHNRSRPTKNGVPTFDRIIRALRGALDDPELDLTLVLRTNVTQETAPEIPKYLDLMAERGFGRDPRVVFQLAPVHSWGNDVRDQQVERSEFAARELDWFKQMARLGLQHSVLPNRLTGSTCIATKDRSAVIDSQGRAYKCTEYPLVPGARDTMIIASLDGLLQSARSEFSRWSVQVETRELPCHSCQLLPVCGSACPKHWIEGRAACPSFKMNAPARITHAFEMSGYEHV